MPCRYLSKAVLILAVCAPGCSPAKPANTLRMAGTNMISWNIRDAATPAPGLTEARVWKIATEDGKRVVILWGDFEQTMNTKDTIVGGSGQFEMETVVARDGRRIEWKCEVKDHSLLLTINKQTFDPSHGSLILVSTGKTTQVLQLERDTRQLNFDEEPLKAMAQQDTDVQGFFLQARQRNREAP